jgi:hypothetical protein
MTLAELTPARPSDPAEIVQRVRRVEIRTREDAEVAANILKQIKFMLGDAEAKRLALTGPLNDHIRMINAEFLKLTGPLKEADAEGRGKLGAYQDAERRRMEQEARDRVAAEQAALEAAEKAREAGAGDLADDIVAQVAAMPDPAIVEKVVPIRTGFTTAGVRKGWAFEVEDAAAVPAEYLTLNDKAINAAIKRGVRAIPGLRIFETTTAVIR